jgi:hypothetical protein
MSYFFDNRVQGTSAHELGEGRGCGLGWGCVGESGSEGTVFLIIAFSETRCGGREGGKGGRGRAAEK